MCKSWKLNWTNGTPINELETKADQAEVRAKIEYHKRIADLRARLKEVGDKIGELQHTGEEPWEDLKQGLESSWEILKASFTKSIHIFHNLDTIKL